MTIREAIDRVDGQKPNKYKDEDKVRWLSDLDTSIFRDLILLHEHDESVYSFHGYTIDDLDVSLLAEDPYTELYIAYLKMKIDEENAETVRYNNSAIMFNGYYDNYAKYINRTRKPIAKWFHIY